MANGKDFPPLQDKLRVGILTWNRDVGLQAGQTLYRSLRYIAKVNSVSNCWTGPTRLDPKWNTVWVTAPRDLSSLISQKVTFSKHVPKLPLPLLMSGFHLMLRYCWKTFSSSFSESCH